MSDDRIEFEPISIKEAGELIEEAGIAATHFLDFLAETDSDYKRLPLLLSVMAALLLEKLIVQENLPRDILMTMYDSSFKIACKMVSHYGEEIRQGQKE